MTLTEWLEEERGRSTRLAEYLGITLQAVGQWKANGVPLHRMKEIRDMSGGRVTLEEMVPDPQPEQS